MVAETDLYAEAVADLEAKPEYQALPALQKLEVGVLLRKGLRAKGIVEAAKPGARPGFNAADWGPGDIAERLARYFDKHATSDEKARMDDATWQRAEAAVLESEPGSSGRGTPEPRVWPGDYQPGTDEFEAAREAKLAEVQAETAERAGAIEAAIAVVKAEGAPEPEWPAPPAAEAFRGVLGEAVKAIAPGSEADENGILLSLLVAAGTSLPYYSVRVEESHRARLYGVNVGDSGIGRKGTAMNASMEALKAAEADWPNWIKASSVESGAALARELKAREHISPMLLWVPELGTLLTATGREGSNLSTMMRKAFDGEPVERVVANPKDSVVVRSHHLGLIAGITPDELKSLLSKGTELTNGFATRIIFGAVRGKMLSIADTRYVGEVLAEHPNITARMARVHAHAMTKGRELRLSDDATTRHFNYRRDLPMTGGTTGIILARSPEHVLRLALVYAVFDEATRVEREHIEAAIAVVDWSRRSVIHLFGYSSGNRTLDSLLRRLPRAGDYMSVGEAQRSLSRNAEIVDEAVDLGVKMGLLRVETTRSPDAKGRGRPGQIVVRTERVAGQ